jgi:hypothetical protein
LLPGLCEFLSDQDPFADDHRNSEAEEENEDNDGFHGLSIVSAFKPGSEKHDADTAPEREDGGHPDAHEKAVVVIDEEPKRHARDEAEKCANQEWVVDFVKHRQWVLMKAMDARRRRFTAGNPASRH